MARPVFMRKPLDRVLISANRCILILQSYRSRDVTVAVEVLQCYRTRDNTVAVEVL